MVGDNIYHFEMQTSQWTQADSHHSNPDGTINLHNLKKDTKSDKVLISTKFVYFGSAAPYVPATILEGIGFKNRRNYRKYNLDACGKLIAWLLNNYSHDIASVIADPIFFDKSEKRYSAGNNKII